MVILVQHQQAKLRVDELSITFISLACRLLAFSIEQAVKFINLCSS